MTPAEEAAWTVAGAAIAAAYDVTVNAMLADFAEKFPKVSALWGVRVHSVDGNLTIDFDRVRLGEKAKSRDEVKPENAQAIDKHLTRWLGHYDLPGHVEDALDRVTSEDGLIWVSNFAGASR